MPEYLPVKTKGTSAIAVCDRCRMKMYYDDLEQDPNATGLRVCPKCKDDYDPYRQPARQPENITLRFPRPDSDLE